jgi:hypothetical protein
MSFFEPSLHYQKRLCGGKLRTIFAAAKSIQRVSLKRHTIAFFSYKACENYLTPYMCRTRIDSRPDTHHEF